MQEYIDRFVGLLKEAKVTRNQVCDNNLSNSMVIAIASGPVVINPPVEDRQIPVLIVRSEIYADFFNEHYKEIAAGLPEEY